MISSGAADRSGASPIPDAVEALAAAWREHGLPEGDETLTVRVGPLRLRFRARDDEIWMAHEPGVGGRSAEQKVRESEVGGARSGHDENEWTRWPFAGRPERVLLTPSFPDRTVVAEPEVPFRLAPDARVRIFVRVPLWVRVATAGAGGTMLAEVPTVVLSDTWAGTMTDGELCYWLGTTARRKVTPDVFAPHLAVCPLQLVNRSDHELPVERLSLRVAHLSVFAEQGRLWSDETRIRFRGADEGSELEVSGRRPDEAPDAVRVAEPREGPPPSGLRGLGFSRLRARAGLGGA